MLVQNPCQNSLLDALQFIVQLRDLCFLDIADIGHQVRDFAATVGHLLVDVVVAEDLVDALQHTRDVVVDEDDASVVRLVHGQAAQRDLGHVDGAQCDALVDVSHQGLRDLDADCRLRLLGRAADMWGQDDVLEPTQVLGPAVEVVGEVVAVAARLRGIDVERGAGDVSAAHGVDQGRDVDHGPPRRVDQVRSRLHGLELVRTDHVHGLRELGDVACDEVGILEEMVQRGYLSCGAHGHQVHYVVVDHIHAHGLSQHRQLGANVAVADDAERLTPDLPALVGDLVPGSTVHLIAAVAELAGEDNNLADDQLGHGAGIAERGVEHAYSVACGVLEVDLVGADAETPNDDEIFGGTEDSGGEFGFGADANDMDVPGCEFTWLAFSTCAGSIADNKNAGGEVLLYLLDQLIFR